MVNQKSIILVPFPYSDQGGKKVANAKIVKSLKAKFGEKFKIREKEFEIGFNKV